MMMHGVYNIKVVNTQQSKLVNNYKHTEVQLLKVKASVWYNKGKGVL
jgi:hypothetical protein